MSEFLSQDEVDSLLKGVTGETEEVKEDDTEGVRPYNMATQERIVRGRMPTMEIINERFARLFRIALYNFIHRSSEVSVGPVKVMKFSEFIRNLPVPANLNLVQVKPLRGNALFIFDPNLVFMVVDSLFGGDGRFHTRARDANSPRPSTASSRRCWKWYSRPTPNPGKPCKNWNSNSSARK